MQKHIFHTRRNRSPIQASRRSWFDTFKLSWNAALHVNMSQAMALKALRGLIGIVLPLIVGLATDYIVVGATVAGGAAIWTIMNMTSPSHARSRILFLSCVSMAAGAFIGSVIGNNLVLPILIIGVVAFGAGLLVAINVPVAMIGMQPVVAILFLMSFAADPLHAFLQAALIFAGAFFAFLLDVLFSPWRLTNAERKALSLSFKRLAEMAGTAEDDLKLYSRALRETLVQSQAILLDRDDHRPQGRALLALYSEAERMRLLLIVLHRLKQNVLARSPESKEVIICLEQILHEISIKLQDISKLLTLEPRTLHKEEKEEPLQSNEKIEAALSLAQQWQANSPEQQTLFQDILAYCDRIVSLLHRIEHLAQTWRYPDASTLAEYASHQHSIRAELYNVQAILKANLTPRSTVFRHAVRLGVTLALAMALYHIPGFPIGRGYWIAFTAFLVLKPDFNTTLTRSVSRLVGTLGGVILAPLLLVVLKPTPAGLVIIVAITVYISLASFFVNYAIYSASMTIAVVALLAIVTPHPLTNVFDRGIDTLIGGVLALIMFLAWPTWGQTQIYSSIAMRVDTLREHFLAVMEPYIHPSTYNAERIAHRHQEARLAHANADSLLERITHEPSALHFHTVQAHGLLEALNSISLSVLALEGYQFNEVALPSVMRDQLSIFVREVDKALQHLSQALTTDQPVMISCTDINAALYALIETETPKQPLQESSAAEQSFLVKEAEQIVRTIEITLLSQNIIFSLQLADLLLVRHLMSTGRQMLALHARITADTSDITYYPQSPSLSQFALATWYSIGQDARLPP